MDPYLSKRCMERSRQTSHDYMGKIYKKSNSYRFLGLDNKGNITNNPILYKLLAILIAGDSLYFNESTTEY